MKVVSVKVIPAANLGIGKMPSAPGVRLPTTPPNLAQAKAPRLALPPMPPALSPKKARPKAKKTPLTRGEKL